MAVGAIDVQVCPFKDVPSTFDFQVELDRGREGWKHFDAFALVGLLPTAPNGAPAGLGWQWEQLDWPPRPQAYRVLIRRPQAYRVLRRTASSGVPRP